MVGRRKEGGGEEEQLFFTDRRDLLQGTPFAAVDLDGWLERGYALPRELVAENVKLLKRALYRISDATQEQHRSEHISEARAYMEVITRELKGYYNSPDEPTLNDLKAIFSTIHDIIHALPIDDLTPAKPLPHRRGKKR